MANKITVTSVGTTANVNATPDSARYYSDKSKEWAISDKLIDNEDYSSKYYANESKKQADISTAKTTEVVKSGNTAVSNIESARDNAITDIINREKVSVDNVNTAGTTQVNLAKEQVAIATNKANIATEQATIATSQAGIATSKTTEVVESGNTALSNIETAKSNALNDINTTGAEYVNNAKQYAQNALNSANNAKTSENNALSYKNSVQESSQTATEQASIAVANANKATTSAINAKTSETNAKSSETRCEEILSRLGTAIKIKGRVNSLDDLPLSGNLDGDAYLIGEEGLDSYPEYYWYQDHWEFLGTSGTSLSWGLISGDITAQTDLQTALDSKQDKGNYALKSEIPTKTSQLTNDSGFINNDSTFVHKSGNETVGGVKTFSSNPIITGTGININNSNDVVIQKQGTNFLRKASNGSSILSGTNTIYVRPNGDTNTTGQLSVATNGTVTGTKFVGSLTGNVTGNVSGSSSSCTGNSATATKATQDSNGNNIVNTYATKVELNTKANSSLSNLTDAGKQAIKTISQEEINNPFSLFDSKYSDHELNNLSWLKSSGQWNAKSVYQTAYDKLLKVYNGTETVAGLSVKLSTETYTDYDFVLNTAEESFRLPLLDGSESKPDYTKQIAKPWGVNNVAESDGWLILYANPYNNSSGWCKINGVHVWQAGAYSTANAGIDRGVVKINKGDGYFAGGGFDNERSIHFVPSFGNGSLYFYVGETVQNANLIDAGRIVEQLSNKQDKLSRYPIEISDKSLMPSWYVVYNDGWCEQGGRTGPVGNDVPVNFIKIYSNVPVVVGLGTVIGGVVDGALNIYNLSTTGFNTHWAHNNAPKPISWQASGYIN